MNEKDISAIIEMIKEMSKIESDKKVSGEFTRENGRVYHFETV